MGATLYTLVWQMPSDGAYHGPTWWRPWEEGLEEDWGWCPECLPRVARGGRRPVLGGGGYALGACPSVMDLPPPGPPTLPSVPADVGALRRAAGCAAHGGLSVAEGGEDELGCCGQLDPVYGWDWDGDQELDGAVDPRSRWAQYGQPPGALLSLC